MKNLFTVLAIALFTFSVSAQEAKPATKTPVKKESCCAKKDAKKATCSADEKVKCAADTKATANKSSKSCCSKKA